MARYSIVIAAAASLVLTALLGFLIIPILHKMRYGQTINEIGPKWHKDKQGTPTMGGFMFILGSTTGLVIAYPMVANIIATTNAGAISNLLLAVFTSYAFGAVGFVDDFLKVVRQQNLGLHWWGKIIMQSIIAFAFLATLRLMGQLSTFVTLPFFGVVNFAYAYYPIAFLLILFIVNAVNLTDGLDGLATSVTLWVMCGYFVIQTMLGQYHLSVWSAALAGGCVGFLFWNFYPAKVFMGDTGSMFLGGAVVALGFCMNRPDIMIVLSTVYILEALSVVIQRVYYKITKGKRVFKMTPIHHHFEMSGWSEVKIIAMFSFFSLICAVIAWLYARLT